MIDDRSFAELSSASCELWFACNAAGRVTYADVRASRLLGFCEGLMLRDVAVPGSEDKLDSFVRNPQPVRGWEVAFVAHGQIVTVSLSSQRRGDDLLVLGQVLPEAFTRSLDQITTMMSEVVELNRTIGTQRNELVQRNQELSESSQGVQALLVELQDRVEQNQHDSEIKTRLVSNLSHELRTPLHSILGLTQLLASGVDGALTTEQEKQIRFIRSSADDLLGLINDVLDIGKLDANQSQLRVELFSLNDLLASMRGVLRPLVAEGLPIELVIEDAPDTEIETDRTKISQILRNLVSNALKFTERGEVRVATTHHDGHLIIRVSDTGIGIAPEDLATVWEEYGQIAGPLQAKGTGLGLPLSKKLAERLGGSLTLESTVGVGSTFTLDVPLKHEEAQVLREMIARSHDKPPGAASILVVEDDRHSLFLYEKYLLMAGFHVLPARTIEDAKLSMTKHRPSAIVLDVMLEGDSSWGFLAEVKNNPETQDIPVLVVTVTNREDKARALGADEFWLKPIDQSRLLRKLREIAHPHAEARVLVIDDDEKARYIIRRHLESSPYQMYEASNGADGVRIAREQHPHVILLDFLLGGNTAFDVIDDLKADPRTRGIPVIVVTSHVLDQIDQKRLLAEAEGVISKQNLSRELAINRIRDALRKTGNLVRT